MRPFRPQPKMSLKGVDPLGMILWSIFILSAIFAVSYGEEFDWLNDKRIRIAIGISMLSLAICLLRMMHIRHTFIEFGAFRQPNLFNLVILFLGLDILLGTQNVLQNVFTSKVLGYDQLTASQLKWPEFLGTGVAALFSWQMRVRLKWSLKTLTLWSMAAMAIYPLLMSQLMWEDLNIKQLWLPSFVIGFGHVGLFIALTVYAQAYCNFKYYFQVLCILGFMRMGIGDVIGIAIWERALTGQMAVVLAHGSGQPLVDVLRELYGWGAVVGLSLVLVVLLGHSDTLRNPIPRLKSI